MELPGRVAAVSANRELRASHRRVACRGRTGPRKRSGGRESALRCAVRGRRVDRPAAQSRLQRRAPGRYVQGADQHSSRPANERGVLLPPPRALSSQPGRQDQCARAPNPARRQASHRGRVRSGRTTATDAGAPGSRSQRGGDQLASDTRALRHRRPAGARAARHRRQATVAGRGRKPHRPHRPSHGVANQASWHRLQRTRTRTGAAVAGSSLSRLTQGNPQHALGAGAGIRAHSPRARYSGCPVSLLPVDLFEPEGEKARPRSGS